MLFHGAPDLEALSHKRGMFDCAGVKQHFNYCVSPTGTRRANWKNVVLLLLFLLLLQSFFSLRLLFWIWCLLVCLVASAIVFIDSKGWFSLTCNIGVVFHGALTSDAGGTHDSGTSTVLARVSVTSKKNHYGEIFGLNISAVQVWTREQLNFCSHIMMFIVPQRVP